nr:hypothetical protein [uncultured Undibacterium sp.]
MATTQAQSDGNLSLQKTELAITNFELRFAEFLNAEMVTTPTKNVNRMNFEELDLAQPNALKLSLSTDQAPAGFSKIWSGMMFIEGVPANVTAWRKN